ncbi:MBL fold metallo-hydrolase [candidate division CSSED10-310 bacterium]|uniref:MBL fold metallo-hydrolase n=1 Tax=candidate division CSSED10-310 bacterium TaxID=2855610 RepID=A0ABV6Z606_UNCC1
MKICILASGSSGNSTVITTDRTSILIDAGISAVKILSRLQQLELDLTTLSAMVITHEHIDHIRGAGPLTRKINVPLYCNRATWDRAKHIIGKVKQVHFIEPAKPFTIGDFNLKSFSVPHDANDPIGLTIEHNSKKIGFATDLGYPTQLIKERLKECHALIIEFNYNRDLLLAGPYTWPMKQRIMGRKGHLSNEDACGLLEDIISEKLNHIILAHISENNNVPDLALMCVQELCHRIGHNNIRFTIGNPDRQSEWIPIT